MQQHREVRDYLLATGELTILETSLYDHYWGLGRDQRGLNILGHVWMDIRTKLRQQLTDDHAQSAQVTPEIEKNGN